MNQPNQYVSTNLSLERLVFNAQGQLPKLGFSRRSQRRYQTVWRHLIDFAQQHQLGDAYSEDLASRFLDVYRPGAGEPAKPNEAWRKHSACCIKVLGDYARYGHFERPIPDVRSVVLPSAMQISLRDFERYCSDQRHLRPSSLRERMREVSLFLDYLASERKIGRLELIRAEDLSAFVVSRKKFRPKTVSRIVSGIRQYLLFLTMRGMVQQDLSAMLPTIRVPRDATIPSAWKPELITRLLAVIDRSSPKGKRDYAILLLACRLGLRPGDIRALTLDDVNWDEARIEIIQSKTQTPLHLPLTEEVGDALIDYLKSGRPQTDYRKIFLRLKPPLVPFSQNSHLHYIVTYWRELAGIQFRDNQRCGLHSLRHSLATQLLQKQTPIHVISDVLGHTSIETTMIYAKADVEALRTAALPAGEVNHAD